MARNVVLVDTASSRCSAVGLECGVGGLSCILSLQEQPQRITPVATVWIPIRVMAIHFLLVAAGSCSGCTVCITLHDSHSASFDYRRQKKGVRGRSDDRAVQEALRWFPGHPTESLFMAPSIMSGPKCDLNGLALIHLIAPHSV